MTMLVLVVEGDALAADFVREHPEAQVVHPRQGSADIDVRMCAAVNDLSPEPPLVIVAAGAAARSLPAVSRSQHALHRPIAEYVLLDPDLPPVTDTWPDTRVTVVCAPDSESSLQARLRGWDLLEHDELHLWSPPD